MECGKDTPLKYHTKLKKYDLQWSQEKGQFSYVATDTLISIVNTLLNVTEPAEGNLADRAKQKVTYSNKNSRPTCC